MCPLDVLALGKFCGEKLGWSCHRWVKNIFKQTCRYMNHIWMLIRNSSTGSRIIPYYCWKPASKAPRSIWDKVWSELMNFTSRYGGLTLLRLGYFHTLLRFPMIGTIVSLCKCVFVYYVVECMKTQFMFVFINSIIKQE